MENNKCRGMYDLLPHEMQSFRKIEENFLTNCKKYGYQEVRTPTLEYLHLFTSIGTLTPSSLSKTYSFLDWDGWSGERVVIRPDGTIPIARLYIDSYQKVETAKLCYVTNIFAFEPSGVSNRERWQCGAEFIGGERCAADTEIIFLANNIVEGISNSQAKLQLSHAGLVKALIEEIALNKEDETELVDSVLDGDWQSLLNYAKEKDKEKYVSFLVDLKGETYNFLQNVLMLYPEASTKLRLNMDDFITTCRMLSDLQCKYEINLKIIRNFEYYTGIYFQFLMDDTKVVGGGRYDDLISLIGGDKHPACGFALYVDSIQKTIAIDKDDEYSKSIVIKGTDTSHEIIKKCYSLAHELRSQEYTVDVRFTNAIPSCCWEITVSNELPCSFSLVNNKSQKYTVGSLQEIIKVLNQ